MSDEHYLKRELYALVQEDREIFEFIQAGSLDGIWYWDLEDPEHEWMSPRFWEAFGYGWQDKQHLTSEWQDMIFPEDLERCVENIESHIADPSHPFDQYVRYRHRDGSTVWVRCRGLAIRDENGKPVRMLGAHTDVTSLKRAEEEMSLLARHLSEANEDLRAFSSSVSHDLQSPLRGIQRLAGFLEEDYGERLDDEGRAMLSTLREKSEQMSQLITDVLAFTRLGSVAVKAEKVDMNQAVRDGWNQLLTGRDELDAELLVSELPDALGDPAMIKRVWANLLENAIKYSEGQSGPTVVEVNGTVEGSVAQYSVTDSGVGFDMTHSDKLFGLFKRLHHDDEFEGSGVGLAFVHRILKRHGGQIWAESAPGEGATFTFTLPA